MLVRYEAEDDSQAESPRRERLTVSRGRWSEMIKVEKSSCGNRGWRSLKKRLFLKRGNHPPLLARVRASLGP